ncbi:hypothetical protein [Pseudonocardia zijingensis]|jgi:MHS family shikimate/dehydroshikimate transporter-like MFS transporter|uniref:MFS transporter n=1 Tax=Pseudonocardia zijingensis TaxID=153376 RepID=A0ABN1NB13_9PSEU
MTTRSGAGGGGTSERRELRRVVFGALVGTALEWYDFFMPHPRHDHGFGAFPG